jgi:hypothetical protein
MMMIKDNTFRSHQVGEKVWLNAQNLKITYSTHKLHAKWYGPFKITDILSHMAYWLQLPKSWHIYNALHVSYLSLYKKTVKHGFNYIKLPPNIIEKHPKWKVKAIIRMCFYERKRQKQYHVYWKGYSNTKDNWESKDNIYTWKLTKQYHQSQALHIRTIRVQIKNDMPKFFKAYLQPPNETQIVSLPLFAITEAIDPGSNWIAAHI